ncbi:MULTISPECIES: Ycf51 family protein [Cyanophyceae]|uniref:Ycf51 family protein n=1 Tax=Cyanophyceae TaxID=3028117 RepID=UPI00168769AB|nr:Ycf51 family protein [Trichocoleus sp. FACHB-40]MBD2005924.1 Ycf51 family protein [Trichocoleus sp. FACHB-40]
MLTTADFLNYAKWAGILTLACGVLAGLGFILQWGIRFRLVGITGFMGVLTGGLFALGLVPLTHAVVPGAVRYKLVYDTGGAQTVIKVPPEITETELDATLRQAASNLFSYGRLGQINNQLTIRARTVIHPEPGVSKPLYLGEVKRSLVTRDDDQLAIKVYPENIAQLPKPNA